jgi:hypothetical protein
MAVYTAINDPEAYFQAVIYTGNGAANHAITLPGDTDMQPDFVWIKNRDATDSHMLFDSVRGATKVLNIDDHADSEDTDTDTLDSFTSDGFQVDADDKVNTNTEDYVAWCWKESATSGFDIVTYTGNQTARTISHSLSAVPHFFVVKSRGTSGGWRAYHHKNTAAPETDFLIPNSDAVTEDASAFWNDTAPTTSVFTVGSDSSVVNKTDDPIVAWLWSEKQGFSKFGVYIGNNSTNGPFTYTGFRPAWLMTKRTDSAGGWRIRDNKRDVYNPAQIRLYADTTEADQTNDNDIDWLANGFKLKETGAGENADGGTYVYAAFAEAPFVNSNGVPCNAR